MLRKKKEHNFLDVPRGQSFKIKKKEKVKKVKMLNIIFPTKILMVTFTSYQYKL